VSAGRGGKPKRIIFFANATKASGLTPCPSTGICRKSKNNFARRRNENNDSIHAASGAGEPWHFDDALPHAGGKSTAAEKISACYARAYGDEPFVRLLNGKNLPDTKNVIGTNVIEIAWRLDPRTGRLIVMSAEDNLVKGASGQAVQNMNILCGFPETAGLV